MDNSLLKPMKVLAVCMETTAGGKNYSGGLGALYGDITRTMFRLGEDFMAVTPLYKNGYVQQNVTENGVIEEYPSQDLSVDYVDVGITLYVPIRDSNVKVRVWRNKVLPNHYGLDSSFPENGVFADITNNLYGENGIGQYDGESQRMMQEVILGVGAIKLCKELGYNFDILHLNEGHGVFAALYMLQESMNNGISFEDSIDYVREHTVFTTHTPIGAGNKSRPIQMLLDFKVNQGLNYEQLRYVGAGENEFTFSSSVAALRLSKLANAVAFRHRLTSVDMWKSIERSCPIIYIDNGIDIDYWQDTRIRRAYEMRDGYELLSAHRDNKINLINQVAKRNGITLDKNCIIIGFARRVVEYKRANLIFTNLERFERLINEYNFQIIFSGKAHPKDYASKLILKLLYDMSKLYPKNVVFLQNYDVEVASFMIKGCDVWLGNPIIPNEACSTSGMKAACNGVLNLSTPDGWWYKSAKNRVNGWVLGETYSRDERTDADALYDIIEHEIMPAYYNNETWARMMMASIYMADKDCSAERMCHDYYAELYDAPFIK